MTQTTVIRCANCAGPLAGAGPDRTATCDYCSADNHIARTRADSPFADRATGGETDEQALLRRYETLHVQALETGSPEIAQQALAAFEGYLRLVYADTIAAYRQMAAIAPERTLAGLAQVDQTIDQALHAVAENLPCQDINVADRQRD